MSGPYCIHILASTYEESEILRELHPLAECEDPFTPEQHVKMDASLINMRSLAGRAIESHEIAANILSNVARFGGPWIKAELRSINRCLFMCEGSLKLRIALAHAASKCSFAHICRLGAYALSCVIPYAYQLFRNIT